MLTVKNLRFSYKPRVVLDNLNFEANAGECICVLGENGAGKTTLFRCILGFLRGYEGEIQMDGDNCKRLSVQEIARRVSYIPQAHTPAFNFTVFQTVLMGTNVVMERFLPGEKEKKAALNTLEMLGILPLAERGYAEISGGERQLALIARALVQNARILVMDEPTANLDYGNQLRMMTEIKKLARQGYLVLLSTHNPEHALRFADRVLVLQAGKAKLYGAPSAVLTPEIIENIYGVPVEIQNMRTETGETAMVVPRLDQTVLRKGSR